MDCKDWLKLLGKDTADPKIKDALSKVGVKKVPRIGKDDLETQVELDDIWLTFSVVDVFPSRSKGGDGTYVFSGFILPLKLKGAGEYKGDLPFKIKRTDSQKDLRSRLGKPTEHDDDLNWDEWTIDDLLVRASYTEDYKTLTAVTVGLPEEV
jgi:hypothetical protein